jgi:hypothetical protein
VKEFLKRMYEQAYDVPNFYLGIENELYCHVFTIFFILLLFLGCAYIIKLFLSLDGGRKVRRKKKREMYKMILGVLEEKDKNKKKGNI